MKIRRTDNPNICYIEADADALWCYGIAEWRVDTKDGKFLMTPLDRDGNSVGPVLDATGMHEQFLREET